MLKALILFVVMFVFGISCQTIINIHNGGNGNGCNHQNKPRSFHFSTAVGFDDYYNSNFTKSIWNEVLRRNPSFSDYVTPIPYYNTTNGLNLTNNCFQDALINPFGMRPITRANYSFAKIIDYIFDYSSFTGFTNLPRNDTLPFQTCKSASTVCANLGLCTLSNYSEIANLSKQNNAPVFFHYYQDSYFTDEPFLIQKYLAEVGINVSVVNEGEFTPQKYIELISYFGGINYTKEIHLSANPDGDDQFCSNFSSIANSSNLSLYEFPYDAWGFGFPVCPNNSQFVSQLRKTLQDMVDDLTTCRLLGKYYGYCKVGLPVKPQFQACYNVFPECPKQKRNSEQKHSFQKIFH